MAGGKDLKEPYHLAVGRHIALHTFLHVSSFVVSGGNIELRTPLALACCRPLKGGSTTTPYANAFLGCMAGLPALVCLVAEGTLSPSSPSMGLALRFTSSSMRMVAIGAVDPVLEVWLRYMFRTQRCNSYHDASGFAAPAEAREAIFRSLTEPLFADLLDVRAAPTGSEPKRLARRRQKERFLVSLY